MEKGAEVAEQKKLAKQSSSEVRINHVIWDCGSSLYDSFELKAFEKQLDSAIASRTLSMPHLSGRRPPPPPPPTTKKPASKISRSLHRLIRAVFRPKSSSNMNNVDAVLGRGFYDRSGPLSTIPESPEFDGVSPEIMRSLVRRTTSDRFTAAASIGISCS
ncbi:hypothetical protein Sango_2256600 [Sesamum angolense]|uniref:Uncharacterized protein n=1 Tax=Sesamum angolense TaxID=2727404 RepID=A0AAE2BKY4_9LAMI|nr:hypothetical protein Sango_2256600 [Sesamum angolense]